MMDPVQPLESSVIRVYHANGNVVGAGFLVAERYVLTCAHVVAAALSLSETTEKENVLERPVQLDFPLLEASDKGRMDAAVVFWLPVSRDTSPEDLAVLKLSNLPPVDAEPVALAAAQVFWEHPLSIFGFPQGHADGIWASGTFQGPIGKGWIQFDAQMSKDRPVEKGFSGAPIWDKQLNAVVGMAVAAERQQKSVTSAYMMPQELLRKPLSYVCQHTLSDILLPFEFSALDIPVQLAYGLCRSQNSIARSKHGFANILDDLSRMPSGAQQDEEKLVQFVAALCLELESQSIDGPMSELTIWGQRFAKDFDVAKVSMQKLKATRQSEVIKPQNPMLLVNIQEDVSNKTLAVEAWLVPDPNEYDAKNLKGIRRLFSCAADGSLIDSPREGLTYADLPVLMDNYLAQLFGNAADCPMELGQLTLYFVLPPSLLNKPIERLVPDWEPLGIGADDCHPVILALQQRSDIGGYKANPRWIKAWKIKANQANALASQVFSDRTGLKRTEILGLKVATSLNIEADVRALALTGTPLALWVRDNDVDQDWGQLLDSQLLIHRLGDLPDKVLELRRNASVLASEADYAQSSELGHHLSILWDDPKRVPPTVNAMFSDKKL